MRMWMVDPKIMCRKHLLGEHVETHMTQGTIRKGVSLAGYLSNNLLEPDRLLERHDELAKELERRGYNHRSPLSYLKHEIGVGFKIDREASLAELLNRCPDCRARYEALLSNS